MIRAIIGTVAVLAGFAIVEQSVDASTGHAGSCRPTQAFTVLQPGESVPVRAEPTAQAAAIGTLVGRMTMPDQARPVVTMTGSRAGWARIALDSAADYRADAAGPTKSQGWIPADLLVVDSRVDGPITAYDQPGFLGRALTTIVGDDMTFRVLGCRGGWLQVINARYGNVWIDKWCAREDGCRG